MSISNILKKLKDPDLTQQERTKLEIDLENEYFAPGEFISNEY